MSNFHKDELNETVRTPAWVGWAVLVLGFAGLLGPLLNYQNEKRAERQTGQAQSLAYQVLELQKKSLQRGRGPASDVSLPREGQVGKSPDGKPYLYRVSQDGSNWVVQVWDEAKPLDRTEVRIRQDQL